MSCAKLLGKVVLDVLSLSLVIAPTLLLIVYGKPVRRGFYCGDDSIKYPYMDDIVNGKTLMAGTMFMPASVFVFVEVIQFFVKKKSKYPLLPRRITSRCSVPTVFLELYKVFGIFVFGTAVQMMITFVGKYSTGRLRPHFLSVCQPNFSLINCTSRTDFSTYVDAEVCTRTYDSKMSQARLSFPSGHSSIAAYVAVFLVLYLQKKMTWKFSRLLKPCLQSLLICVAAFVCLSRTADNKHHWSDVLAGAITGSLTAIFTILYVWMKSDNKSMERDSQQLHVQVDEADKSYKDTRI